MNDKLSTIIKYAVTAVIGLLIALAYVLSFGIFTLENSTEVMEILHNGFFISGVLLAMAGLLTFCNKQGVFDGLGYSFEIVFISRNWSKRKFEDRRTFTEYKEEKAEKRKTSWFLVIVGGAEIVVSLIFLGLYYLV